MMQKMYNNEIPNITYVILKEHVYEPNYRVYEIYDSDLQFSFVDFGFWISGFRSWVLDLDFGFWILDFGTVLIKNS